MKKRYIIPILFLAVLFMGTGSALAIELQAMPDPTRSLEVAAPAVSDPLASPLIIPVKSIQGNIPSASSPAWREVAEETIIPMSGQVVAKPRNYNPTVKVVYVQAVTNGKEIGIRLRWTDGTRDEKFIQSEQFKDAAAVEFPVKKPETLPDGKPHFAMGNADQTVNIWHWKSEWQKDMAGMADMEDQYPNMAMGSAGYYMYEPASRGTAIDKRTSFIDAGSGKDEGVFNTGSWAGNIFSDRTKRISAVEDLNAEGFGTLTTQAHQDVKGSGDWSNSEWSVIFIRPVSTPDANDAQLDKMGDYVPVAFAIWDGSNGERDGLKSVTSWHYLKMK